MLIVIECRVIGGLCLCVNLCVCWSETTVLSVCVCVCVVHGVPKKVGRTPNVLVQGKVCTWIDWLQLCSSCTGRF